MLKLWKQFIANRREDWWVLKTLVHMARNDGWIGVRVEKQEE